MPDTDSPFESPIGKGPVTVARFSSVPEADLAVGRLQAEGIDAALLNDNIVTQNWLYSNAIGGIQVQVPAEDAERALEVLGLPEPAEELQAEASAIPADISCPTCGSVDISYIEPGKRVTFLSWLFLGYPVIQFSRKLRCHVCGAEWQPNSGV
jgi:rubredoxin